MVVLQINKFFYDKGGTERYYFLLCDALAARGHDIVHFSMDDPRNRPSADADLFVPNVDFDADTNPFQAIRRASSFIRSRVAAKNLAALLERRRPDIAHLHNIYHQITPSILPVLEAAGIPVVMTLHDYKLVCPNYSLFAHGTYCYRCEGDRFYNAPLTRCCDGSLAKSALLALEATWQKLTDVYDSISRFVAPSRFMRDTMVAAGYAERRVAYVPGFMPAGNGPAPDDGVGQGLPDRFVLYFGRLSAEKGVGVLLDAVAQLPEVPLVVCGDGPLHEALAARGAEIGADRIRFTGHVSQAAIRALLERAAAVVVPTLSPENAPYTVLEAAAAAVPVIVSDMGGLPEMADVVAGRVVPVGDVPALAEQIDRVWREGARARAAAREGSEAARAYFAKDTHMDRIEAVYEAARAAATG